MIAERRSQACSRRLTIQAINTKEPARAISSARVIDLGKEPRADHGGRSNRPPLLRVVLPSLALAGLIPATFLVAPWPARADLALCRAWRQSGGQERILLGNRLGESHYLTKNHRLQSSPEQAPISLYRPSDLRRLCDDR